MKLSVRLGLYALLLGTLFLAPRSLRAQDLQIDTWGANAYGQIGNGKTINVNKPYRLGTFNGYIQVTGGISHSLALRNDGTVWAWGRNDNGQLGIGSKKNYSKPIQVKIVTDIVQIAASGNHSLALRKDGVVFAWGENNKGQIGNGTVSQVETPVNVNGLPPIKAIGCGKNHSLAVAKADGRIYAWGENTNGQLGDGSTIDSNVPLNPSSLSDIVQIVGGDAHSIALQDDGTIWATGKNDDGQIGNGTNIQANGWTYIAKGYSQIAAGASHSLALAGEGTGEGAVWSWGLNNKGQLGDGTTINRTAPSVTPNFDNQNPAKQIVAGGNHSLQLRADGSVLSCGFNSSGQLGTEDTVDKSDFSPISNIPKTTSIGAGSNHSLAVVRAVSLDFNPTDANYLAQYGAYTQFKALFTLSLNGKPLVGKPIKFFVDGFPVGISTTDGRGIVKFTYKVEDALTINDHAVDARFEGDTFYLPIDSASIAVLSVLQTDTVFPKPIAISGKVGETVTLQAKLRRTPDKAGLAGKEVLLSVDRTVLKDINGNPIVVLTNSDGFAIYQYKIPSKLKEGNHTVTATFGGTDKYNPATVSWQLTVTK